MEDQQLNDDSHYEISLTATQAFVAFVLLLLSLAASFAFGVMVGRGQLDPDAAKRARDTETTQITERPMPVAPAESAPVEAAAEPAAPETVTEAGDEIEISSPPASSTAAPVPAPAVPPAAKPAAPVAVSPEPATATSGPVFAQLLATSDAKRAESLAAKLIDDGFTAAFVDRVKGDKGTIHRVRVRFKTDADARAAVPRLQPYTTEKVLVTTK
ncbi:MAG: SPOR domain-containing protein [Thermoanaerobaculia bacterium]